MRISCIFPKFKSWNSFFSLDRYYGAPCGLVSHWCMATLRINNADNAKFNGPLAQLGGAFD